VWWKAALLTDIVHAAVKRHSTVQDDAQTSDTVWYWNAGTAKWNWAHCALLSTSSSSTNNDCFGFVWVDSQPVLSEPVVNGRDQFSVANFSRFRGPVCQIAWLTTANFLWPTEPDQICSICHRVTTAGRYSSLINWQYFRYDQYFQYVPLELEWRPCIWRRNHVYITACLDQHLITIRSPGIHGDHVLQAWTWSFTLLVSSHLLTQHMETVINCSVLHTKCWKLSQHQQRAVHCAGRSRGAWMHGAAMGSCTHVYHYQPDCSCGREQVSCKPAARGNTPSETDPQKVPH